MLNLQNSAIFENPRPSTVTDENLGSFVVAPRSDVSVLLSTFVALRVGDTFVLRDTNNAYKE